MPIHPLDARGLLPEGIHTAPSLEIERFFCFNPHREQLWRDVWGGVSKEHIPLSDTYPLFVCGSFLSDKPAPDDIELALQLTPDNLAGPQTPLLLGLNSELEHARLKTSYRMDFYVYYGGIGNDFSLFFQYAGEKTAASKNIDAKDKRGIIRVNYDNLG